MNIEVGRVYSAIYIALLRNSKMPLGIVYYNNNTKRVRTDRNEGPFGDVVMIFRLRISLASVSLKR